MSRKLRQKALRARLLRVARNREIAENRERFAQESTRTFLVGGNRSGSGPVEPVEPVEPVGGGRQVVES